MQLWIPWAKHNGSNFFHTLALSLSLSRSLSLLIIFYVEQSAASPTNLQTFRRCLELEPFRRHVGGGVEPVRSTLDGFWDQAGVFIDLYTYKQKRN